MSKIVAGTYEAAGHWGGANPWDVHYRVKR